MRLNGAVIEGRWAGIVLKSWTPTFTSAAPSELTANDLHKAVAVDDGYGRLCIDGVSLMLIS